MNFSIVLTTYNGEKFIYDQLVSILEQTILPNEVLIFDDQSSDETCEIIQSFINNNHLDWHFQINQKNLGWKENFYQGIQKTKCDLVFLSDQDDLWKPDKCEVMIRVMEKIPNCNLLLTNYLPFSDDGSKLSSRKLYHQPNDKRVVKIAPNSRKFLNVLRPGCTYCFRKTFFNMINRFWVPGIAHDQFLYFWGLYSNSVYLLRYQSIRFRRHKDNNTPKNIRTVEHRIVEIEKDALLMRNLVEFTEFCDFTNQGLDIIFFERIVRYFNDRLDFYKNPSIFRWIKLSLRQFKYYPSLKTLLGDFYICMIRHHYVK